MVRSSKHAHCVAAKRGGLSVRVRLSANPGDDRTPVLFLGGAFQSLDSWSRFEAAFAGQARTLAIDYTSAYPSGYLCSAGDDLDEYCEALAGALTELDVPPVFLVTASYGSAIGYRFAQLHPELIDRMALTGVAKALPESLIPALRLSTEAAQRGDRRQLAELADAYLLNHTPGVEVERRSVGRRVLRRSVMAMSSMDLAHYAENTWRLLRHSGLDLTAPPRLPTLVFTGEHDCFTTPRACREVAAAIPGARFTLVPRADHLMHLERFDYVVDLLRRFHTGDPDSVGVPASTPQDTVAA